MAKYPALPAKNISKRYLMATASGRQICSILKLPVHIPATLEAKSVVNETRGQELPQKPSARLAIEVHGHIFIKSILQPDEPLFRK